MMIVRNCNRCGLDYMFDPKNHSEYKDKCQNCVDGVKVGDKVFLTENTRVKFGYPDGIEGTVIDIITEPYNIVVHFPEIGDDPEFFTEEELIRIER